MVSEDIAIDTRDGGVFQPDSCLGNRPTVCRLGLIYTKQFQCERGLVTNDEDQRRYCALQVTPRMETAITEVKPGHFIIVTWGESYLLQCRGAHGSRRHIDAGVYHVSLTSDCIMHGDGWRFRGMTSIDSNTTLLPAKVDRCTTIGPNQQDTRSNVA